MIGGSVAAALRSAGWRVTGRDIDERAASRALELGVVDDIGSDPLADLTVVAVPPQHLVAEVLKALEDTREAGGVVTDTGSVKHPVTSSVTDARFVAGHPMAGSEQDGVDGADPDLFRGNRWVLTPSVQSSDESMRVVRLALNAVGAEVVTMTPERHDRLVALVSHVPHLTAASLMDLAAQRALDDAPLLRLAAGGFRDMTRIAAGHPGIWLDIVDQNAQAIVAVLDEFILRLQGVRTMVVDGDQQALSDLLGRARAARRNLPDRNLHPQELLEVRVPIPDRPGQIAAISMLAADCDVNVADIEVAHSPEGNAGVLVLVVARTEVQRLLAALAGQGYHPTTRDLA